MKKSLWISLSLVAIVATGALSFKLFEPIFTYRSDWNSLPEGSASVNETSSPEWASKAAIAENALKAGKEKMNAPAVSAALSVDGEIVWRGAIGMADVERGLRADFDTRFRIGSTSKAVTAAGVGVLIDSAKLSLNQPITGFPHRVTLGQVMSHRAGIRNYGLCLCFPVWEHQNRRHFRNIGEQLAIVANSPLLFKPGSDFSYTSLGYNLSGAAIERASGQPFDAFMQQAVFQPLGMTRTSLSETGAAGFYETERGRYKRAFSVDNSIREPSGGIVSTPSDMVALGNAMLDDRLLTSATRKLLVTVPTEARTQDGKIYAYGWRHSGWTLYDGNLTLDSYHHNGTAVGSSSVFVIFPEKRVVLSLMMNKGGANVDDLSAVADQILQAFVPSS